MLLSECTAVIRSKSAGPFVLTLDVFFTDESAYRRARSSPALTAAGVAAVYGVAVETIRGVWWNDTVHGVKISMTRWSSSSDPFCTDLFGAHLHTPLANCEIT